MGVSPENFFPVRREQEERIRKIEEQIRLGQHPVSGRGYRISDDVLRYARPIYMKSLTGSKKASSKYSYAGFEQLVHISSGLIRHFLEPAALMYNEQKARNMGAPVLRIEPRVQDEEVEEMSGLLMTTEFDKIATAEKAEDDLGGDGPVFVERKRRLQNLLMTLGGTFRQSSCLTTQNDAFFPSQ